MTEAGAEDKERDENLGRGAPRAITESSSKGKDKNLKPRTKTRCSESHN